MKTFILLITLLSGVGLYLVFRPLPIGGLSSRYAAQPQDPFLTAQAASARPIILAVRQYIQLHGQAPTEEVLKAFMIERSIQVPTPQNDWISPSDNGPLGAWFYLPEEKGFRLHLKLGWDPALLYEERAKEQGDWIFDPGDGCERRSLI